MKAETSILPKFISRKLSAIEHLCRKHQVKNLWVFGSVLREDYRPDSDIDILYELDEKNIPDEVYLDNLDTFADALTQLLGRKTDFVHAPSLKNPYFIREIEATKIPLYVQKPEEVSV